MHGFTRFVLSFVFIVSALLNPAAAHAAATLTEDGLVYRNSAREAHDRRLLAEQVNAIANGTAEFLRFNYELKAKLETEHAASKMEVSMSLLASLRADIVALETRRAALEEGVRERIANLRAAWELGTQPKVLSDLAKNLVEIRQIQLAYVTALSAARDSIVAELQNQKAILDPLLATHSISSEEYQEIYSSLNAAIIVAAKAREALALSQSELEEAKKDMESTLND